MGYVGSTIKYQYHRKYRKHHESGILLISTFHTLFIIGKPAFVTGGDEIEEMMKSEQGKSKF